MIAAKHPINDFSVYFDEEKHQYKIDIEKNQEYWLEVPSVTQFINHYSPPFDENKVSAIVARKKGKTQAEILAEWKNKRDYACDMGTRIHANQEKAMKEQTDFLPPQNERERQIMFHGFQAIQDMKAAGFVPLTAEQMIFSMSLKLAGTIDAIFQKSRILWLVDWKTNEKIDRCNEYHNFMFPPAETLEDCAFNHYKLQLNLYERILKTDGYIPKIQTVKKMLIHLRPQSYEIINIDDEPIADKLLLDYMEFDWFHITPF